MPIFGFMSLISFMKLSSSKMHHCSTVQQNLYLPTKKEPWTISTLQVFINEEMRRAVKKFWTPAFLSSERKPKNLNKIRKLLVQNALSPSTTAPPLLVVLLSLGIGKDDEIIVPSHTAFPTIEPILSRRKTRFVDINEKYYTIDPKNWQKCHHFKTKAIIRCQLRSNCQTAPTKALCQTHNLLLIEDCCRSSCSLPGSRWALWHCQLFQFLPSRILPSVERGMIVITIQVERKCRIFFTMVRMALTTTFS